MRSKRNTGKGLELPLFSSQSASHVYVDCGEQLFIFCLKEHRLEMVRVSELKAQNLLHRRRELKLQLVLLTFYAIKKKTGKGLQLPLLTSQFASLLYADCGEEWAP